MPISVLLFFLPARCDATTQLCCALLLMGLLATSIEAKLTGLPHRKGIEFKHIQNPSSKSIFKNLLFIIDWKASMAPSSNPIGSNELWRRPVSLVQLSQSACWAMHSLSSSTYAWTHATLIKVLELVTPLRCRFAQSFRAIQQARKKRSGNALALGKAAPTLEKRRAAMCLASACWKYAFF